MAKEEVKVEVYQECERQLFAEVRTAAYGTAIFHSDLLSETVEGFRIKAFNRKDREGCAKVAKGPGLANFAVSSGTLRFKILQFLWPCGDSGFVSR